jgi:DNA repair exonuclease SbcCD ATPase subunit
VIWLLQKIKSIFEWLLFGVALVGAAFLFSFFKRGNNRQVMEEFKEIEKREKEMVQIREKIIEEKKRIDERVKERGEKAQELSNKMQETDAEIKKTENKFKKYFQIILIFFLLLPALVPVYASDSEPPPIGELIEPTNFEEALDLARQMKDFALEWRVYAYKERKYAEEWKVLYEEEHQDLELLEKEIEILEELLDQKQEIIELLKEIISDLSKQTNNGGINFSTGLDIKPLNPVNNGLLFQIGYQF